MSKLFDWDLFVANFGCACLDWIWSFANFGCACVDWIWNLCQLLPTLVAPAYAGIGLLSTLVVAVYTKSGVLPTLVAPDSSVSWIFANFGCLSGHNLELCQHVSLCLSEVHLNLTGFYLVFKDFREKIRWDFINLPYPRCGPKQIFVSQVLDLTSKWFLLDFYVVCKIV